MVGRRRQARRRRGPPATVRRDGTGHLIGLELEAKLFGRIRLLTVEATAVVSDGDGLLLDVIPGLVTPPAIEGRPLPSVRATPRSGRVGLAEAEALVRDARELLPRTGVARR